MSVSSGEADSWVNLSDRLLWRPKLYYHLCTCSWGG